MSELEEMLAELEKMRRPGGGQWFRVEAKADTDTADVYIYDEIGPFTVSAQELVNEIRGIKAKDITVHLNTPGGDAFGGIAIYNTLKDHPANVTIVVDGMAASAGSLIAQAGDTVRMNRGAQMMIHDASGIAIGRANDMESVASMLNKLSDSMAGIYAARAGGTVEEWRDAMRAESWYSAVEAVQAGLADELMVDEPPQTVARASWDLSAFAYAYAGRAAAPPPTIPHKPKAPVSAGASSFPTTAAEAARRIHAASQPKKEGAGMDPAKIREALGLSAGASDDEVRTALASAGLVATSSPPAEPPKAPEPTPMQVNASVPPGAKVVSESVWDEMQEALRRQQDFIEKTQRDERDQVIAKAIEDGKFTPAQKDHFSRLWNSDPKGTRELIDSLTKNSALAVAALGYDLMGDDEFDREFANLFPPTARKGF